MIFKLQPLKGIVKPKEYRIQLQDVEEYKHYRLIISLLFLLSVCVYVMSGIFGIGTESLSKELSNVSNQAFEARKQLFLIGRLLQGILIPCVFLFGSALYYFAFLNGDFRKLMIVQINVFGIFLIEKIIQIPLFLLLNIDSASNIFSLGIIAQYMTDNQVIIHFLSEITLFRIAMIGYSYYYLSGIVETSKKTIIITISALFIVFWIFASFMSYIKIGFFF